MHAVADLRRLTDDELLTRTEDGREAFGVFYERHAGAVLRLLARATGDGQLAYDLTAEVFLAAWVARKRYRPGEAPARAWLFGIARNKLAASRKRLALDLSTVRALQVELPTLSDRALEELERVVGAEQDIYVEELERLSPGEREAIRARVLEGRRYDEIAGAAGASEDAIRQRVSRGLAKLSRTGRRA